MRASRADSRTTARRGAGPREARQEAGARGHTRVIPARDPTASRFNMQTRPAVAGRLRTRAPRPADCRRPVWLPNVEGLAKAQPPVTAPWQTRRPE